VPGSAEEVGIAIHWEAKRNFPGGGREGGGEISTNYIRGMIFSFSLYKLIL
jgi:hypothetical protein